MVHLFIASSILLALIGSERRITAIYKIAFLSIFFFAAFRYMYGNDYLNYLEAFWIIKDGGQKFSQEILYVILNKLTPSFHVLIAITSAFFVCILYNFLIKNVPIQYAWIGMFILLINPYIFLVNLSAIRQCLAMTFFILATHLIYTRKYHWYIISILLAALFHKSALILLPICFIVTPKPVHNKHVWLILFIVFALFFFVDLDQLLFWGASFFQDKNYIYFAQQDSQNSLRATLLTSLYFFYTLFNLPKMNGKTLVFCKLYLIGTILGVLAFRFSMFTRIQMYFDVFSVVALPMIFKAVQDKGYIYIDPNNALLAFWQCINKYAFPILLVSIYLLRYYSFFTNPLWYRFNEYHTIFSLL